MIDLKLVVDGAASEAQLMRIQRGLSDRRGLHQMIGGTLEEFSKDHVKGLNQHRTAERLGAVPTQHLAKAAVKIESEYDQNQATLRFPRRSRLRAAFGTYTVRPTGGRKFLAIPDHRRTYGKSPREIAEPLAFAIVGGRHPALVFQNNPDKGTVAYWLKRSATIKEDRTLLPFDQYPPLARAVATSYIEELATEGGAA